MIYTKYGKDWLIIDESNYLKTTEKTKTHLINLTFTTPTKAKVEQVIKNFPSTNRYIVNNNIKIYNNLLKNNKKYYVMNNKDTSLISFFRKNNKVLLNMSNLDKDNLLFVENNIDDILLNVEVVYIGKKSNINKKILDRLNNWNGNVLIS